MDNKGREMEKYEVPTGARLKVKEGDVIEKGQVLCEWNPHKIPILAEVGGKVRYDDVMEGETMRLEKDPSGNIRRVIIDHRGTYHPQIVLEDADGKPLDVYFLPEKAVVTILKGRKSPPVPNWRKCRVKPPALMTSSVVCLESPKSLKLANRKNRL